MPCPADGVEQIVEHVRRLNVIREKVVHFTIGEITLLLTGVDQLLDIFKFFVESQTDSLFGANRRQPPNKFFSSASV